MYMIGLSLEERSGGVDFQKYVHISINGHQMAGKALKVSECQCFLSELKLITRVFCIVCKQHYKVKHII